MIALLERLLPLWTEPVDGRGDPEAAFGEVYADPVAVGIAVRTIDVLTIAGGLVTAIWVVADDLGLLRQLDAARLNGLRGTRQRRGPPHRLSDAVLPPVYGV